MWLLNRRMSISAVVNALLVLAVLFPFVPRIVPSTDTQPTFLLVFGLSLAVAVAAPVVSGKLYRVSLPGATALILGALVIYGSLVAANALQDESTIPSRLVSFLQFGAAAVWGYAGKFRWNGKVLYGALLVYCAFTIVYFATNGAFEDFLIQSRTEGAEFLFTSGRGARTLSPEPSFFALHIFNLFVLARILSVPDTYGRTQAFTWLMLTVACLASSLSAYGALLLVVVLFATYPKVSALVGLVLLSSFSLLLSLASAWDSIRAIRVILALVESRGRVAELMVLDASFYGRMVSFTEYVASFARHPFFGDGFSVYQGGGFVSVVAALGLVALLFFAAVLNKIVRGNFSISTKAVLLIWLTLNFVSGPVGVPILGVIVGTLFKPRRDAQWQAHPVVAAAGHRAVLIP